MLHLICVMHACVLHPVLWQSSTLLMWYHWHPIPHLILTLSSPYPHLILTVSLCQAKGCYALRNIALGVTAVQQSVIAAGGAVAVVNALAAHRESEEEIPLDPKWPITRSQMGHH
jgi:hypothetical protein